MAGRALTGPPAATATEETAQRDDTPTPSGQRTQPLSASEEGQAEGSKLSEIKVVQMNELSVTIKSPASLNQNAVCFQRTVKLTDAGISPTNNSRHMKSPNKQNSATEQYLLSHTGLANKMEAKYTPSSRGKPKSAWRLANGEDDAARIGKSRSLKQLPKSVNLAAKGTKGQGVPSLSRSKKERDSSPSNRETSGHLNFHFKHFSVPASPFGATPEKL